MQALVQRINATSNADFVKRLLDEKRKTIPAEDGKVMTHRLGYVEEDGHAVVFPDVQSDGDSLRLFPYPESYERAVQNGDTVQMSPRDARMFTTNYKKYYPSFDYAEGGGIHIKPENRGKFTALKERTGHSSTWFKEHGTPAQKKMAVFALNARKWKHGDGGLIDRYGVDAVRKALQNRYDNGSKMWRASQVAGFEIPVKEEENIQVPYAPPAGENVIVVSNAPQKNELERPEFFAEEVLPARDNTTLAV